MPSMCSEAVDGYCPIQCPEILVYLPRDSWCVTGQIFAQCRSTMPLEVRGRPIRAKISRGACLVREYLLAGNQCYLSSHLTPLFARSTNCNLEIIYCGYTFY